MPFLDAVLAGFQPFVKSPTTAAAYSSMQDERVYVRAGEMERLNALISVIETAEVPVDHSSDLSARFVESSNHRQAFVNLVETIVAREQSLIEDGALHQCFTHFSLAQKVLLLYALEKNHSIPEEFVADMNELRDLLSSAIELDYQLGADGLGDPAQHGVVLDAADFVFLTRRACELLAPEGQVTDGTHLLRCIAARRDRGLAAIPPDAATWWDDNTPVRSDFSSLLSSISQGQLLLHDIPQQDTSAGKGAASSPHD